MMNVFVAIDSFKGSMTSNEANKRVKEALSDHQVETFPIADGGEGTVDAFVKLLGGTTVNEKITGPAGTPIEGKFGWVPDQALAIIEVAEGAGITKVSSESLHPSKHTSFGVGEQILSALQLGAKEIIIGLGGSATVDGGFGMMQALGVEFLNEKDQLMDQLPIALNKIKNINLANIDQRLHEVKITVASDVVNPLCGMDGATYIFGPQKGLDETELETYDKAMQQFQHIVNDTTHTKKQNEPGAGAAGGIGFSLYSFLKATFKSGFDLLAEKGQLEEKMAKADIIITGEGKFDRQSTQGKVPVGISRMAKKHAVPTIVFTGYIEDHLLALPEENILAIIPIVDVPMTLTEAMANGPELLNRAVKRTFHMFSLLTSGNIFSNTH